MPNRGIIGLILAAGLLTGVGPAWQAGAEPAPQEEAVGQTPPRLGFTQGQVSFWRVGAQDWVQAQVNTPLAPGDQLYTGSPGNLELQIGGRAFVRAWANTQVGLETQEPDFLQFKVTAGTAAFDLRTLEPGRTLEVDTPHAAFTIEHAGYYRVAVGRDSTSFIARRAGRATVTPAGGAAVLIASSEEVVVEGVESPRITSYAAPQLDEWDRWNYARTEALLDAVSARHVTPGTFGVDDLDHYGTWRVVDTYGPVWVPSGVPTGWVPYSTGSWVRDPFYGWTWVDTAPWGWAPYHHGRWVFVNGFWAWAPGPVLARPVYAPALVVFFGGPGLPIGVGGPLVGWVALGWGEPCVPWWGRTGFMHRPWWGGWGGPRVVNNIAVHTTTVVNVEHIHVYRNSSVRNGVVFVDQQRFGQGRVTAARVAQVDGASLQPIHAAPQVPLSPASLAPTTSRGIRPPGESLARPVIATHRPPARVEPGSTDERKPGPAGFPAPAPRLVPPPQREQSTAPALPRPPFGQSAVERSTTLPAARPQPPAPQPKLEAPPQVERKADVPLAAPRPVPQAQTPRQAKPAAGSPSPAPSAQAPARPAETPRAAERSLPGEPANHLAPNRVEPRRPPQSGRQAPAGQASPPAGRPQGIEKPSPEQQAPAGQASPPAGRPQGRESGPRERQKG